MAKRKTTEQAIADFCKVHGNRYDYSRVVYKNNSSKVKIICPVHGEFEQIPAGHIKGHGCRRCGNCSPKGTLDDLIRDFSKTHGNLYDYSKVVLVKSSQKVIITCKIHGDFNQRIDSHKAGRGCGRCATEKNSTLSEEYKSIIRETEKRRNFIKTKNEEQKDLKKICRNKNCELKGKEQPLTNFHFDKSKKDGRCSTCKICAVKRAKLWAKNNPGREKKRKKDWAKLKGNARYGARRHMRKEMMLRHTTAARVRAAIKKTGGQKGGKTFEALPYTPQELRQHIENQFDEKMNWDNYGDYWQIDHIIPQAALPYKSLEEENFQKCWALENLRPLEATENMSKGSFHEGERHTYINNKGVKHDKE